MRTYFTPFEAEAALPLVHSTVREVTSTLQDAIVAQSVVDHGDDDDTALAQGDADRAVRRARDLVDDLGRRGIDVRELDPLVVGFRALRHGQQVWLLWRQGDAGVQHWQRADLPELGRLPVQDARAFTWLS